MSFISDYEIAQAKQQVSNWKGQVLSALTESNYIIDKIITDTYGAIERPIAYIERIITNLEAMKIKYPQATTELQGYIDAGNNQLTILKARYTTDIGNKVL